LNDIKTTLRDPETALKIAKQLRNENNNNSLDE